MPLANCERCGRMFQTIANIKICSRCRENDDEVFKIVKEYIYNHPGITIEEVSEKLDVTEKIIQKFLRENRLEIDGDSMLIECEKCGDPIKSGRFCNKCTRHMTKGLKNAAKTIKEHIEPHEKINKNKTSGKGMHTQLKR